MSEEAAFLSAIRTTPDDDTLRLVFADWLDERGREDEAALIRLGCQLEPHYDRYDDDGINTLRNTVTEHERKLRQREHDWFRTWTGFSYPKPVLEWRRGFVETLGVPAQWFVSHGAEVRARYPLLRRLVLFRLNGWGERVAGCPALAGLPELELACWYEDADAEALARSRFLSDLQRLVVWAYHSIDQGAIFARGTAWPKLRDLHLIHYFGTSEGWVAEVDRAAGRPLGSVYHYHEELFPFAVGSISFRLGKLPDGRQIIAYQWEDPPRLMGWHFDAAGRRAEPFRFEFPPELAYPPGFREMDSHLYWAIQQRIVAARIEYLRERIGFVPAFVRVGHFNLEEGFGLGPDEADMADEMDGPTHYSSDVEDAWGRKDEPAEVPDDTTRYQNGYGEEPYRWIRRGCFGFRWGDYRWHDRSGRCYMS